MKATIKASLVPTLLAVLAMAPGIWAAFDPGPGRLDRPLYDNLVRSVVPRATADDSVVFVDIDDGTLQALAERWPIQRATWAKLIRKLNGFAPSVICLDAFFPEPNGRADSDLALSIADRIRDTALGDDPEGELLADELDKQAAERDADRQLTRAIAEAGNVVLGVADGSLAGGTLIGGEVAELQPVPGLPAGYTPTVHYLTPRGSISELAMAARAQAGLHVSYSADGVIRRYGYVARAGSKHIASLALAVAQIADPKRAAALATSAVAIDGGDPLIRWPDIGRIRRVPLIDVLEADPTHAALHKALKGRIVFVGVSAIGAADRRQTPLRADLPGTYVHAAATLNLLNGEHTSSDGPHAPWATWGLSAASLALYLLWRRITATSVVVAGAVLASAAWLGLGVYGLNHGALIPLVPGVLAFTVPVIGEIALRVGRAELQRQQIREAFQFYLAPAVVEQLVNNPDRLKLGGERREITAFFSDVAGFTTLSERLDPAELTKLLNEYLGAMTDVILEEGGTVDKYIGDAIVAMFGAPIGQPDHAVRACRAALRCRKKLAELQVQWRARGLPEIASRIGLNSGVAVVGNMGSAKRFDYTMLGDAVNLAARLEGANKAYGTDIMIGAETARLVGSAIVVRELDLVQVKGKKQGIAVFEAVAEPAELDGPTRDRVTLFAQGLALWRKTDFDGAAEVFGRLAAAGDAPSQVFLDRLPAVRAMGLGPDWDGVFEMTTK
ncbi:MAG: adenylate/guanylate cyclase domain-containing protein [Deltaproteobacteria bacterium]|nr:adenylate/guanylate cyclase domain-containing protein [Deltaproteobacteria bacterium]